MIKQETIQKMLDRESLNGEEIMGLLGDIANGNSAAMTREAPKHLKMEHRYLQGSIMNFMLNLIDEFAKLDADGAYDDRNVYACKVATAMKKAKDNFTLTKLLK